jgi:hypothetical protein
VKVGPVSYREVGAGLTGCLDRNTLRSSAVTRSPIVLCIARALAVRFPERQLSRHGASRRLGLVVLTTLVAASGCTSAADPHYFPSASDGPVYLVNADTNTGYPAGSTIDWDAGLGVVLSAAPAPNAPTDTAPMRLPFVAGSMTETPFMSSPGSERKPANWRAWSDTVSLNGKGALLPNVTPSLLGKGASAATVPSGTYSLGVAYEDSPTHVSAVYFTTISVNSDKATFTFATPKH